MANTQALQAYDQWNYHSKSSRTDTELVVHNFLSKFYPDHHVTRVRPSSCDLLGYAKAGLATATPQHDTGFDSLRTYVAPAARLDNEPGRLEGDVTFGQWRYEWEGKEFILYQAQYESRYGRNIPVLFVLCPLLLGAAHQGNHPVTDSLLLAASQWTKLLHDEIYVFDSQQWVKDSKLYKDVQGSSWDDVILDPATKTNVVQDILGFFDNREIYQALNVPWKRGVIFHGVPGNGKTISLKALINSLYKRPDPIPALYVKSFDHCSGTKFAIHEIFSHARSMAPCLLIFEDLDSLVGDKCRSYFLNEVDGLEANDGILMVGSTNHLDRLDPAITKRPSRFDRKYHFKVPDHDGRTEYCRYWSRKFTHSGTVDFPDDTCPIIASLTEDFSFAYLKELFIASLVELARGTFVQDAPEVPDSAEDGVPRSESSSVTDSVMVERIEDDDKDETAKTSVPAKRTVDGDKKSKAASAKQEKPKREMPIVKVPASLKDNLLLRIITRQAKILFGEMDNTEEVSLKEKKRSAGRTVHDDMGDDGDDGDDRMLVDYRAQLVRLAAKAGR